MLGLTLMVGAWVCHELGAWMWISIVMAVLALVFGVAESANR